MSKENPNVTDYLQLFDAYGKDLGKLYEEPEDDRYKLLFEQVVRLLIKPSSYNRSLPAPFRDSARRYYHGDQRTTAHLSEPAVRHFMLCELHDIIMLKGGLKVRREDKESAKSV